MIFRLLALAGLIATLAGCAVPIGQIRNGRFVSEDHGSLRIVNKTVAFDLRELPPGERVRKRVFYRLQPNGVIDLNLRRGEEYRTGVGSYRWRFEDGAITATARREETPTAIFARPDKRRRMRNSAAAEPAPATFETPAAAPEPPSGDRPLPVLVY